jgi:hypothetical protein
MTARSIRSFLTGAAIAALVLFYPATARPSLPLTETIYAIPESEFEAAMGADIIRAGDVFRRERASLGFGVLDGLSVWYAVEYLDQVSGGDESGIGDSFLKIWYCLGSAAGNRLHGGLLAVFRVPTGPSAYDSSRWRNVSLGVSEIRSGAAVQWELAPLYIHGAALYIFRQGEGEDFYGGFSGNPSRKKTWSSVLGLNPLHGDAFLYRDRLRNDYASVSLAANTLLLYPVVPFIELYFSHRVYRRETENDRLPIEGAGVNPLLGGGGCRYFITSRGYLEVYAVAALLRKSGYIREIFGISAALQF